jgi:hypothetical protein
MTAITPLAGTRPSIDAVADGSAPRLGPWNHRRSRGFWEVSTVNVAR